MKLLFKEFEFKWLKLKNRIVMPPLANNLADEQGGVTEQLIAHYLERAKGGVGMIIVEHSYVTASGKFSPAQLGIDQDRLIPGLKELVRQVQAYEVKIGIQLNHSGGTTTEAVIGTQPLAPSLIKHPWGQELPRELTGKELEQLADCYAQSAVRAKTAGFDFVEVHGAHGYLLNQFYSPLTNRRKDAYGGTRENRLRFPLRVVERVRQAVGKDYPVFYRLGADDLLKNGLTIEDALYAAPRLVETGIDLLDISGGLRGYQPKNPVPPYFTHLSSAIKKAVTVPVLVTGGITESEMANRIIEAGEADLVGIGRALLKDPNWAKKALESLN